MMPGSAWWQQRSVREQWVLRALAALVVAVVLVDLVGVRLRGATIAARDGIAREQARLDRMQRQSREIAELSRLPEIRPRADALERVRTAIAAIADDREGTLVESPEAGAIRVRLASVPFDALGAALEPLLRESGLQVRELSVSALADSGRVRAEILLAR
jgi:type II secretory pathway component PulM